MERGTSLYLPYMKSVEFSSLPGRSKKQGSSSQCMDKALYWDHGPCMRPLQACQKDAGDQALCPGDLPCTLIGQAQHTFDEMAPPDNMSLLMMRYLVIVQTLAGLCQHTSMRLALTGHNLATAGEDGTPATLYIPLVAGADTAHVRPASHYVLLHLQIIQQVMRW